jgi:lipopolysaccharide transport system ATP-binding protein
MSNKIAVSVAGLDKRYQLYERQGDRLRKALWGGGNHKEILALNDVSFALEKGETLAVIGRNGSGKSTLLQIVAGILKPTTGNVSVNGRVAALLELGNGFEPEFTGRENVFLNGAILGLSRRKMVSKFDDIAAFADIGEYINQPIKEYSTGMLMRLAFAVQVMAEPDILIVDEALSVGDFFFQQKCLGHIRSLCAKGVTLLFVSHDMGVVRDLCKKAVFLDKGNVVFSGDSNKAARMYLSGRVEAVSRDAPSTREFAGGAHSSIQEITRDAIWRREADAAAGKNARLLAVAVLGPDGRQTTQVKIGERIRVRIYFRTLPGESGHLSLIIKNRYDQTVFNTGTYFLEMEKCTSSGKSFEVFEFEIECMLEAGEYSLMVAFGPPTNLPNQGNMLDQSNWFGPIQVTWNYETEVAPFLGMFGLPVRGRLLVSEDDAKE